MEERWLGKVSRIIHIFLLASELESVTIQKIEIQYERNYRFIYPQREEISRIY